VVACFGSPYLVERFPAAKTWLAAFSTVDVAQRAVGRAIFGQVRVGGKLPVNIPGGATRGAGLGGAAKPVKRIGTDPAGTTHDSSDKLSDANLKAAYDLLDRGVTDHAFPGGVLAVGHGNEVLIHAFGRQTYEAKSPAIAPDTIYDAASLTKPVVTTTLAA